MSATVISIVIAGLTTGGLTCFAVQGGLLTTVLSQIKKKEGLEKNELKTNLLPTLAFVGAKIITYTIFGALLGLFGSFFTISTTVQAWLQIVVSLYMVGIALQLLNIHPIFRYFIIQPPAYLQRLVRKIAKGNDELTTPILLGASTLIIPCGTTLAMEALAVSSGSWLFGSLIMFLFISSSSWIFLAVSLAAAQFNALSHSYFNKITAALLMLLALISLNGGLNLLGSSYSVENLVAKINSPKKEVLATESKKNSGTPIDYQTQKITMKVTSSGYKPDKTILKKGVPVELTLVTKDNYTCAIAFTIPKLGIQKVLSPTGSETIVFTPNQSGNLAYSCSMGMYRGNFIVE